MGLYVDIKKKLKDVTLDISFETGDGQGITGLLGASGCGKSMTLKCIAGIMTPDQGRIVLNGKTLFDSEKKICMKVQERRIGYLFQNYALFPNMTVRQNIEIAVRGTRREKETIANEYMDLLRVRDLECRYPKKLSGGQQQRAAFARILASNPDVLMLDEPFSALDYFLKEQLQLDLYQVLKQFRGDILMVTHNRDEIYRLCSKIHILDQGKVVVSGSTKEVFRNPQAVAAAKLTGCKNIVKACRLSDTVLEIPQWKACITFRNKLPEQVEYIGVRAHYLRPRENGETTNVLSCHLKQVLEDPFEVTLIYEEGIWWKLSKKEWDQKYARKAPDELVAPEESVFFLSR